MATRGAIDVSSLPEVRPANQVNDSDGGNKDDADVQEEPGGRIAILVGGLTGHSQEKENQAGDPEENGPQRDAGDVGGQGIHAVMLTNGKNNQANCSRLLSLLLNVADGPATAQTGA